MIESVDNPTATQATDESRWALIEAAINTLADAVFTIAHSGRMTEADVATTLEGLQVVVLCRIVQRARGPREAREGLIARVAETIRDSTVRNVAKVLDEEQQRAQEEAAQAREKGQLQ